MAAQKTEDLSHLIQYRDSEGSYQTLLKVTRQILAERLRSPIFIPEDLWARHHFFGVTGGVYIPPTKKAPIEWNDLLVAFKNDQNKDSHEVIVIQLIRSFLFYAVSRGDMKPDRLISSENTLSGFSFVEPTQKPSPQQRAPPKKK